ncbi:hypothetical protein MHU86_11236 [Fragilaria crotonensis]|nr:hypothetical protein MHU86_11236 [Fragilaria crotonensis]
MMSGSARGSAPLAAGVASIPSYDNKNCGSNDADSSLKPKGVANKADAQDDSSSKIINAAPAADADVRGRTIEFHHNLSVATNEDTRKRLICDAEDGSSGKKRKGMNAMQSADKNEKKEDSSKDGDGKEDYHECSTGNYPKLACYASIEEANTLDFCVIKNYTDKDDNYFAMEDSNCNTGTDEEDCETTPESIAGKGTTRSFGEGGARQQPAEQQFVQRGSNNSAVLQQVPSGDKQVKKRSAGGRRPDQCWQFLSNEEDQHMELQTRCKSCGMLVKHHTKSEKVKWHLKNCRPFKKALAEMKSICIPEWMTTQGAAWCLQ